VLTLGAFDARIALCDLDECRGVPTGKSAHGWFTWNTLCANLSDPSTLNEFKSAFYEATHYALSQGQSWTTADNVALYQWGLDTKLEYLQQATLPSGDVLLPTRWGLSTLLSSVCRDRADCLARFPLLAKLLEANVAFFPPSLSPTQTPPPPDASGGMTLAGVLGYGAVAVAVGYGLYLWARPRRRP